MNTLDRILYVPELTERAKPVPFPAALKPIPSRPLVQPSGSLPAADVLIVTYTVAEAEALADVLTPGVNRTEWIPYAKDWAKFLPHLTVKSPAREAKRLASYWTTEIGKIDVVVVKSELHLATDDDTVPIVELWKQMIGDVSPQLVITTGTAGGIGPEVSLGDVAVAAAAQFDCAGRFAAKPWAHARYESAAPPDDVEGYLGLAQNTLIPVNAGRLTPVATRDPWVSAGAVDVLTTDRFEFDDTTNTYGLRTADPEAATEEMDDATLGLAVSSFARPLPWLSVRNASDPQVPSALGDLKAQAKWADATYERFGYWTSIGSAIVCWALCADLDALLT